MESEGSLQHSHAPVTYPYPEPDQSNPRSHPISWRSILILSSHLRVSLPGDFFPSGLTHQYPVPYLLHVPPISLPAEEHETNTASSLTSFYYLQNPKIRGKSVLGKNTTFLRSIFRFEQHFVVQGDMWPSKCPVLLPGFNIKVVKLRSGVMTWRICYFCQTLIRNARQSTRVSSKQNCTHDMTRNSGPWHTLSTIVQCASTSVRPRLGKLFFFCIRRGPGPNKCTRKYLSIFLSSYIKLTLTKLNSVALVRTRTIPTERPPPVGEVSANFCG